MMYMNDLQKKELEILKEFIRICKKLKITYYLDSGTLLGCIRHEGFIPWDDDIDVSMPRKDFDIFIKKAPNMLQKKFFIQTNKSDKEYTMAFAKLRNSETTFIESTTKHRNINHGIYMDIFPLDNYDTHKKIRNNFDKFMFRIYDIYINKYYDLNCTFSKKYKIIEKIINFIYRNKDLSYIVNKKEKISTRLKNKNTDFYHCYYYFTTKNIIYNKEIFGNGIIKKFEGIDVNVPQKYDEYLKLMYGDYMKLPPKEKRVAHHYCEIIDMNKSYIEYTKQEGKK